jgi:hypothetical protein
MSDLTFDEAREMTLRALEMLPSGPPSEEILNTLLAEVWAAGRASFSADWHASTFWGPSMITPNPYRPKP